MIPNTLGCDTKLGHQAILNGLPKVIHQSSYTAIDRVNLIFFSLCLGNYYILWAVLSEPSWGAMVLLK